MGDSLFCPTVRRTAALRNFEAADLPGRCREVVAACSQELLKRALGYLYAKKTKFPSRSNISAGWSRYVDMTPPAEALFGFIGRTIEMDTVRLGDAKGKIYRQVTPLSQIS